MGKAKPAAVAIANTVKVARVNRLEANYTRLFFWRILKYLRLVIVQGSAGITVAYKISTKLYSTAIGYGAGHMK